MISANFRQRLLMRLDFGKEPQLLSFLVINRTKLFESVRHFWLLAWIFHKQLLGIFWGKPSSLTSVLQGTFE